MAYQSRLNGPTRNADAKWMLIGDSTDLYTNTNKNHGNHSSIFNGNNAIVTKQCKNYTSTSEDLEDLLEIMKHHALSTALPSEKLRLDDDVNLLLAKRPEAPMLMEEGIIQFNNDAPSLPPTIQNSIPAYPTVALTKTAISEKKRRGRKRKYVEKNGSKNAASKKYNGKQKNLRIQRSLSIIALTKEKKANDKMLIKLVQTYNHLLSSFEKRWLRKAFPEIFDCFGNVINF